MDKRTKEGMKELWKKISSASVQDACTVCRSLRSQEMPSLSSGLSLLGVHGWCQIPFAFLLLSLKELQVP